MGPIAPVTDDDTGGTPAAPGGAATPAGLAGGPRLIIRAVPLPRPTRRQVARRLVQASRVAVAHLSPVGPRIARRQPVDDAYLARQLRKVFDDLGGSFAKFGQLIGSSPSLFGERVAAEFRSTLDDVTAVPFADVRRTIEDELGLPLSHLFDHLDPEPLAAASLAVVHRGRLHDGRDVAVKVLRPGIEEAMAVDLAVMGPLFDWIGREVAIGIAGELPSLVSGLAEQLSEEVDLRNEARSMLWFEHLRQALELDRLEVPLPVEGMSAKRVLVMDFLDGVAVDDVAQIAELGIDPAPLVQDTVKAWFATAICTGAFHGDVHAGNLLVTRNGNLGVLDWGIVGRLDDHTQRFFRRVVEGALGDESAWPDVWSHAKAVYGPALQEQSGMTDEQMTVLVRMQIEPLFTRPFGEIRLQDLLMNPETGGDPITGGVHDTPPDQMSTYQLWKAERRRRREQLASGVRETSFDRGMFLLGKQLVYFDRYGKLFLPDVPLMWDRAAFERLVREPMVPAEVPFE